LVFVFAAGCAGEGDKAQWDEVKNSWLFISKPSIGSAEPPATTEEKREP
jgi:hypothetical protein